MNQIRQTVGSTSPPMASSQTIDLIGGTIRLADGLTLAGTGPALRLERVYVRRALGISECRDNEGKMLQRPMLDLDDQKFPLPTRKLGA